MKRKAIVCDVDGVLLQTDFILQEIFELGLKGDEKWDYFYEHCNSNRVTVIPETKRYIDSFINATYEVVEENEPNVITIDSVTLIVSTARNERCRIETDEKLYHCGIEPYRIYMRACDDLRSACKVKREHLLKIMEEYDIVAFIDDDLENCEIAKSLEILSLRRV